MHVIPDISALRSELAQLPRPLVLVPTMGALHEGHLTLVRRARELAGKQGSVALSLFVNPTQFNNPADLESYPRTLERDLALCREHGVDLVFTPGKSAMYQPDHSVNVIETSLSTRLCGATRPGHFEGVCTVVLKLFNLFQPDIAAFGKKDYQQLAIIRRMVRDLNVPIHLEGVDTVREPDGLAMSSRNARLSEPERRDASRIHRALTAARELFLTGENNLEKILATARREIEKSPHGARIDYLELVDASTLQPLEKTDRPALLATAVFYGDVRLIDNIEL